MFTIEIADAPFDPCMREQTFRACLTDEVGAVVSFLGLVRGGHTDRLELTHYPAMTTPMIEGFIAQARARFGLLAVAICHRVGVMLPGDPIVQVLVASAHRRAAFDGVDYLMDLLKSQAPFWKCQHNDGQARWIEPTANDHINLARWQRPHVEPAL